MARATRIALDLALAGCKALRPRCAIAWRYAKVEMIPPNSQSFFHGPGGKKLEEAVSKFADGFIAGLERRMREIEAEKERLIIAKQAVIKAAHDKAIAEGKTKEEQRLKAEAIKKAQEAKLAKEKTEKVEIKTEPKIEKTKRNKQKKVKKKEITKTKGGPKAKK